MFSSRVITLLVAASTLNCVEAYYDGTKPIVKMYDYDKNYRTLSCEECFRAEGKMCMRKDGASMISYTGSSNSGHGLCCKPGWTGDDCIDTY